MNLRDKLERPFHPYLRKLNERIHPNQTSWARVLASPLILWINYFSSETALVLHWVNSLADWIDWTQARAWIWVHDWEWWKKIKPLTSIEWSKLDPLVDKIVTWTQLAFLSLHNGNEILIWLSLLNILVDIVSQLQRWPLWAQIQEGFEMCSNPDSCTYIDHIDTMVQANWYWKVKMIIQSSVIALLYFEWTWIANELNLDHWVLNHINSVSLLISATLWTIWMLERMRKAKTPK